MLTLAASRNIIFRIENIEEISRQSFKMLSQTFEGKYLALVQPLSAVYTSK